MANAASGLTWNPSGRQAPSRESIRKKLEPSARKRARLDFRARVIRNKLLAAPAHHAKAVVVERAQEIRRNLNEIIWTAVNGNLKLVITFARAIHLRLVVPRHETRLLLLDTIRDVVRFQKTSCRIAVDIVPEGQHVIAWRVGRRPLAAGFHQRGEGGSLIIRGPALDLGEADRLEPDRLFVHGAPPKEEWNRGNDCRERQ